MSIEISNNPHEIIIEPPSKFMSLNLKEVWEYKDLLFFLAWRDIKIKYKQTLTGILSVTAQPLISMVIYTVVFSVFAKMPSDGIPYPVFFLAAFIPWILFSSALNTMTRSIVTNANIIKKVYFPRLITPLESVFPALLDFCISFVILMIVAALFGYYPDIRLIFLPVFICYTIMVIMGIGLILAALYSKYRDAGFLATIITQVGMYLTPVVYPASLIPASLKAFYYLNPMVSIIDGFRWMIIGLPISGGWYNGISLISTISMLILGLYYFRHAENTFADVS